MNLVWFFKKILIGVGLCYRIDPVRLEIFSLSPFWKIGSLNLPLPSETFSVCIYTSLSCCLGNTCVSILTSQYMWFNQSLQLAWFTLLSDNFVKIYTSLITSLQTWTDLGEWKETLSITEFENRQGISCFENVL